MPAYSSDFTSRLHCVRIPLAPSVFGCHNTLLCLLNCILGISFVPSYLLLEGESSLKINTGFECSVSVPLNIISQSLHCPLQPRALSKHICRHVLESSVGTWRKLYKRCRMDVKWSVML
ncbi:hypothetical protein CHARACLAT_033090 [Characodon lateralis]|uniref:Uncharacterized protein n=1 Tax=Characodon lateralis TaxID=208331 RepID=A0ABU7D5M5_9TELE|nr:hypothetical protein [Characodon lateralis]